MKGTIAVVVLMAVTLGMASLNGFAGASGRPAFVRDRVLALDTDAYHIVFRGGELARVEVRGDGDTDLDLYVYDEVGNLVASDDDATDYCVVTWTPRWTGEFTVRIVNRGNVYNAYRLRTN